MALRSSLHQIPQLTEVPFYGLRRYRHEYIFILLVYDRTYA
jgi:hypothetical protein